MFVQNRAFTIVVAVAVLLIALARGARADSASCLAKAAAFVAEMDALLEKENDEKPQLSSKPYVALAERYFPLNDCEAEALLDVVRKSRFIRSIQHNSRANEYYILIEKDPLGAWISYLVSERRSVSAGAGFVRKP
jgi:hypothetical protein